MKAVEMKQHPRSGMWSVKINTSALHDDTKHPDGTPYVFTGRKLRMKQGGGMWGRPVLNILSKDPELQRSITRTMKAVIIKDMGLRKRK